MANRKAPAANRSSLARPIRKIAHETMQQRVYDQLRTAFLEGRFLPGEALTIRGLAEMTGTSVQPVREALQRLDAEGAVDWLPNTSFKVPAINPERYAELWVIRKLLEGHATRLATQKIDRGDLAKLRRANKEMRASMQRADAEATLRLNRDFHFIIYRASNSPILVSLIETIWMQVSPLFAAFTRRELGLADGGLPDRLGSAAQDFFALQDRVTEAIANRRAADAVQALNEVLDLSQDLFANGSGEATVEPRSSRRRTRSGS
jgi:DNA-binding GntR family transcriptional regulator